MIKRMLALAALLALPLLPATTADAATLRFDGGITKVKVTAPLGDLGLTASGAGTTMQDGVLFRFPITGGDIDGEDIKTVEHDGAGLTLSAAGGTSVTVGNFVIDVEMAKLLGTVGGGTDLLPLFDISETRHNFVKLNITDVLAGALTSLFGAPDLTGVKFGQASVKPIVSEVPLPASALLLLAGVGGLAGLRRRKAAA